MKFKHFLPLVIVAVLGSGTPAFAQPLDGEGAAWWGRSIWRNPERGSLWYPPARAVLEEPTDPAKPEAKATPKPKPTEVQQMAAIKERLTELREVAIINPTHENVRAYIAFQEENAQRASVFADTWRRVLWETPDLQYQFRPTNATGLQAYDTQYGQTLRGSLAGLANTHGLYFFFRSDCPYCHAMAPTLKLLEQQHGIKIVAISLDGKGISQFPGAVADAGQAARLGVKSVPAFYLAAPSQRTVMPLGTGVLSLNDLEDRIYTQAFTKPGEKF